MKKRFLSFFVVDQFNSNKEIPSVNPPYDTIFQLLDGKKFYVHKSIICQHSEYFEIMLSKKYEWKEIIHLKEGKPIEIDSGFLKRKLIFDLNSLKFQEYQVMISKFY